MNLYCDNYKTCRSVVFARDNWNTTVLVARVRNWRVYRGPSLNGQRELDVTLCPTCARLPRPPAPAAVLEGQEPLFPPPGDPGTVEPGLVKENDDQGD